MNILVTGASRGIGKEIALSLEGNIFATSRNEEALRIYQNFCVCDLTRDLDKLGRYIQENNIDVLINNAGDYIYSPIEDVDYDKIERIVKTNLEAPLYLISKAVPYMKQNRWGRIINIGSISGVMGEACASIYSASKAGLIGATKALALELAAYNITINSISPGWVETDLTDNALDENEKKETLDIIPQKRFVEPIEIANLVKYLVSNEAKGLTGQNINLCAGLSCGC